ncbi:sugar-binding transcriptional regulator [Clostridium niameyense]|uniref:Sugar-binding transcriptional regulator n=1 Tax=Clostridium niameyense TaxID=1622073 RepID=A0A6M0RD13_9CLOT|nr:sugar-binding domain-containing protein [Clostridium niameyense]NEZ47108.1 sugar-binding transcriptional regulator [Clostridium niameyense]
MKEILKLQQKIVPEMLKLLEKRYTILRTIYYKQPIGRRILANDLGIGERIVRTEVNFLKSQNLIDIDSSGMTVTKDGEKIIDKLKEFIHELKGLSDIEELIRNKLEISNVIIVPGDLDEDITVKNELGKVAANYLRGILTSGNIIAVTGGTTVKEVVDNMPKINNLNNLVVVPARGGIGRDVETQANTLVANLAGKINANYKLMHVPDNLSEEAIEAVMKEKQIKEVLDIIHQADILIHGIGIAEVMAERRGVSEEEIDSINHNGALGEAFGYYFDMEGRIVYSSPTIGIKHDNVKHVKDLIAISGGTSKGKAILAAELRNTNSTLITDEGAAIEIMKILEEKN